MRQSQKHLQRVQNKQRVLNSLALFSTFILTYTKLRIIHNNFMVESSINLCVKENHGKDQSSLCFI